MGRRVCLVDSDKEWEGTDSVLGAPTSVNVYGRKVEVPWAVDKVARFTFAELCEEVRRYFL